MKILFGCKIADLDAKKRIEKHADVVELSECTEEAIIANLDGVEALIVPYTPNVVITKKVIDAGKSLKLVGTTYGGTRQNVEDVYAIEKGLYVIHTGPTRPRPMAEYTLGLTLSSLLEIHNYHHYMNSTEPRPRMKFGRSRILHNRRVGIIGLGLIGRGIKEVFGMFTDDIWVRSNHMSEEEAVAIGVKKASLNEIFENCEIIILAGGHVDATTHLIGREQFELMQDRGLFVNIARGKIVDEAAMADVASKKNIYLALDVFEVEPLPDDSPLRQMDNVLMTPHRANNPIEFEQRWDFLADEFDRYAAGEKPETALDIKHASVMSSS